MPLLEYASSFNTSYLSPACSMFFSGFPMTTARLKIYTQSSTAPRYFFYMQTSWKLGTKKFILVLHPLHARPSRLQKPYPIFLCTNHLFQLLTFAVLLNVSEIVVAHHFLSFSYPENINYESSNTALNCKASLTQVSFPKFQKVTQGAQNVSLTVFILNSLSSDINIIILLTDLWTALMETIKENLSKYEDMFSLVITVFVHITWLF